MITIITDERNGNVVSIKSVQSAEQLLISTTGGMMIRIPVNGISIIGRATKGVRLMRLNEGDKVTSVAVVASEESNGDVEDEETEDTECTDIVGDKGVNGGTKDAGMTEPNPDEREAEMPDLDGDEQEAEERSENIQGEDE